MKIARVLMIVLVLSMATQGIAAVVFEDFVSLTDTTDWVYWGSRDASSSFTTDGDVATMTVTVDEAMGGDWESFLIYTPITVAGTPLDFSAFTGITLTGVNVATNPAAYWTFKMQDTAGRFIEHFAPKDAANGMLAVNGDIALSFDSGAGDFVFWAGAFDFTSIQKVEFHINGDSSDIVSQINLRVDDMILTPEPATMCLLGLGGLLIRRKK